jgi:hypothetical protein
MKVEMIDNITDYVIVEIAPDYMEASVILTPSDNAKIELEDVIACLNAKGIKMGIDSERIQKMLDSRNYNNQVVVAVGKEAENGQDGQFEFFFDLDYKKNPVETEDGSVDFRGIRLFMGVKKGDVLARYIPPTIGAFGYDVRGTLLKPKKGKSLAPLRGRGFDISEDGKVYFARIDGKVEYHSGQLDVSEVYEHWGNLDFTAGDIRFSGDVHIRGNVESGMKIEASGNVEVDGHVAGATIISGADIIIVGGMQGKGRGNLEASGKIMGKFFEDTRIRCGGDISTNYLLNCDVYTRGTARMEGKMSTIIGGMVHAVSGIDTQSLGNDVGKATAVRVGAGDDLLKEYATLHKTVCALEKEITALTAGIEHLGKNNGTSSEHENHDVFNKLFQNKILKVAEKKQHDASLQKVKEMIDNASLSQIVVHKDLYAGVSIFIGHENKNITSDRGPVRIRRQNDTIVIDNIY